MTCKESDQNGLINNHQIELEIQETRGLGASNIKTVVFHRQEGSEGLYVVYKGRLRLHIT